MAMNNNQNKQDSQKRFLLAIVLSLAFFMAYNYFYIEPQQRAIQEQQTKSNTTLKMPKTQNVIFFPHLDPFSEPWSHM